MASTKILNGKELAGFIKERQAGVVSRMTSRGIVPTLLIIRDSDDPVISKYVELKVRYGEDIGVRVIDYKAKDAEDIRRRILAANEDNKISGMILQLPIKEKECANDLTNLIIPEKDVDGLGANDKIFESSEVVDDKENMRDDSISGELNNGSKFESATATAILWLLAGYDIDLKAQKVALVGRGKLVGAPLYRMLKASKTEVEMFHRGSDLTKLKKFDIIISATGVPGLILSEYVKPGAVLVDAGTASENGVIRGDLAPELYERKDLKAITPVKGGVGPLTVACLFEHLVNGAFLN